MSTPENDPQPIAVTEQAAHQIRMSSEAGGATQLHLRIAAALKPDGGIDYRMGFDEVGPHDLRFDSCGVSIVIAESDRSLVQGATLDYVEIEPGNHRFIFLNPNDTHYRPPVEE